MSPSGVIGSFPDLHQELDRLGECWDGLTRFLEGSDVFYASLTVPLHLSNDTCRTESVICWWLYQRLMNLCRRSSSEGLDDTCQEMFRVADEVVCTYLGRGTLQRHHRRIRVRLATEVTRRGGSELWQWASTALDSFGTISHCCLKTGEGILWVSCGGL
jgi:hypothetical protein